MSLLDTASLIVTPNGYKEGKLYSVIPSDGSGDLSVTRATTATRVNSQGLVELVPYNLLTYSEQFDNADWQKYLSSVTANSIASPNGTLTADSLVTTSNSTAVLYRSTTTSAGLITLSVYAKAGTSNIIDFGFTDGTDYIVRANLSTGAIVSATSGVTGTIQNVGNGWYRITATRTMSGSGNVFINNVTTTASQFIYIWGAQLVEGSVAKDYQKTETRLNIPRLDYSNGTCPSILVEPQRTNIATYSEAFNLTGFSIDASISANTTTSPSGIQNADSLIENTANGNHLYYIDYSVTNGTTYTYSVFCKSIGGRNVEVRSTNAFAEERAIINLSDGSIFSESTSQIAVADFGNGWYRISITKQATTSVGRIIIFALDGISLSYQGNGTSGLYLFGAQLEAGSYATSYIPTTSASVTRNADVISKTGISSLIGQTEGTFFLDMYYDGVSSNYALMQTFQNASQFNVIQLTISPTKRLAFEVGNDAAILAPSALVAGRYKMAGAYKNNDFVLYLNGDLIGTDTSGSVIATDAITFNDYFAIPSIYKQVVEINSAALWKTRLTNTQLAQLTTI